jgi:hypothetical protein
LTAPAGNDVVVMVRRGELIESDMRAMADAAALSVTLTVNVAGPIAVAVPDTTPLSLRLRPSGRDPLSNDQTYGGDPPVAVSPWEYAIPTVPAGNVELVMVRARELMVTNSGIITEVDALSVTLTVKRDEPVAAGVPVMVPATRSSPAGSDPLTTDHV